MIVWLVLAPSSPDGFLPLIFHCLCKQPFLLVSQSSDFLLGFKIISHFNWSPNYLMFWSSVAGLLRAPWLLLGAVTDVCSLVWFWGVHLLRTPLPPHAIYLPAPTHTLAPKIPMQLRNVTPMFNNGDLSIRRQVAVTGGVSPSEFIQGQVQV